MRLVATLAVAGLVAGIGGCGSVDPPAELIARQDLPVDVRHEVDTVWSDFERAFAARLDELAPVELELVASVAGGDARYVVDDQLIEIQIPTSPRRFRESLAHELAHHIEHRDPGFSQVQRQLADKLGVPVERWFEGETWEATPSEIWAEAVVLVVNGERVRHRRDMAVDAGLVGLVEAWGHQS